jgi:hypothetical protein
MIVNISYLNASNGMFWYAIDKIKTLGDAPVTVLVNAQLAPIVRKEVPHATVHELSKRDAALRILRQKLLQRSPERIIAFTSHPLPFVRNQTIAFHDDYPFMGWVGQIKRALFALSAWTSGCRVGIVNRSLAIPFLTACGIGKDRIFFDSAFPAVDLCKATPRSPTLGTPLRIGLVGTDSRKKNYNEIFAAIVDAGRQQEACFILYGSDNDYVGELRDAFPSIKLVVVSSDDIGPVAFFDKIDYLVSAARSEGYGRPMGLAAALGVPLFLLRSPVFLEFFGEHATFFDHVPDMMRHIIDTRPPAVSSTRSVQETAHKRSPFFA